MQRHHFYKAGAVAAALAAGLGAGSRAFADTVQYTSSPGAFPQVTSALGAEFGTAVFPPLTETPQMLYQVDGSGPVDLSFRFKADTGSFLFNFGFYRVTPALMSIDLSSDAGKIAYATQALAPGNATLVFNDSTDNPGAARTLAANGGDVLGFFLTHLTQSACD